MQIVFNSEHTQRIGRDRQIEFSLVVEACFAASPSYLARTDD
jgi:hypothetical protein